MTQQGQAPVIVSLSGITQVFDTGTTALQDFSLDVHEGEFVSLLGPSGCGKSSALRIVAGLSQPTSGSVSWPQETGAQEHELGFVFQESTLMPWSTVFANVWLPLRLKGVARAAARERVLEALATVGLEEFADHYPRQLSGGMKMRVSIARALITRPKVLLMDEPFAALDEITRFKLNNDLLRLQKSFGWTVLFVTHSVFESVYLSDRVVVMAARPGRVALEKEIVTSGPREEGFRNSSVYNDYCRDVSAALQAAMEPADSL
ncbi:ABC transporter ATP-binding protein [Roseibium sp. M-1]